MIELSTLYVFAFGRDCRNDDASALIYLRTPARNSHQWPHSRRRRRAVVPRFYWMVAASSAPAICSPHRSLYLSEGNSSGDDGLNMNPTLSPSPRRACTQDFISADATSMALFTDRSLPLFKCYTALRRRRLLYFTG